MKKRSVLTSDPMLSIRLIGVFAQKFYTHQANIFFAVTVELSHGVIHAVGFAVEEVIIDFLLFTLIQDIVYVIINIQLSATITDVLHFSEQLSKTQRLAFCYLFKINFTIDLLDDKDFYFRFIDR